MKNKAQLLYNQWIACYMLYDYNPRHADNSYGLNGYERHKRVVQLMQKNENISEQEAWEAAIKEEIMDWKLAHAEVWKTSLKEVNKEVKRVLKEIEFCEMLNKIKTLKKRLYFAKKPNNTKAAWMTIPAEIETEELPFG